MTSRIITRTIWILSFTSLFTDMASEMLYPVMPSYLVSIGFNIAIIGLLEGLAEATAGLSKGYFGAWSDRKGIRVPFVRMGYTMSSAAKPLLALSSQTIWVFLMRTMDRLGKGVRTGARDAMLAQESTAESRAKVFGFHRSMDTAGAVLGPLLALLFLHFYPERYITLFLIAILPGVVTVVSTFLLKDDLTPAKVQSGTGVSFSYFVNHWKEGSHDYRRLMTGLIFFALLNSSDMFLLLRAKWAGHSDEAVILLYVVYNLVYALLAYPAGWLADRFGIKLMWITGLLIFTVVYTGFVFAGNIYEYALLFALYGAFAACSEGISKAWISLLVSPGQTATAIGSFAGLQSIAALLASATAGIAWTLLGSSSPFLITAAGTFVLLIYFVRLRDPHIVKGYSSGKGNPSD
ncbi:MAG: MFS transporter [Bacteroidetes bacterium]|nr:MFS transporter [Bacteroidota bacterium]